MHNDGGRRCAVIHIDGEGQCIRCDRCGKYIRPRQMMEYCDGNIKPAKSSPYVDFDIGTTFVGGTHDNG